ncbi:MAG TPA: class I SAM-dependent methyltransferase [Vicinamibacterales bacterium]|nr:class I SAM-dependent methyltransferase [Vicinamibacterales bacterium]
MAKGLVTVVRRRGVSYFRYLVTGVAAPWTLYRFAWGPRAARPARRLFAGAARVSSRRPSPGELEAIGVLAARGTRAVRAVVAGADVLPLLDRAHRAGVTGLAAGFDDVLQVDGDLRFAHLPDARVFRQGSASYFAGRDADRVAFNRRFNAELMTEERARTALRTITARLPHAYRDYAPIDFGHGLVVGQVASTDSGTGRWEYCNLPVVSPLVAGKRVLDLGCNNGALSLMMLRAGASRVLGVEVSPEIADAARLHGEILSWRDMHPYDFTVLTSDMRVFLQQDLGVFDVVTAFCSLYYLPGQDMAAVVRKAAGMGAALILQANDGIRGNLPARTRDLRHLMLENGYPGTVVHALAGFARPVLAGHPARGARQGALPGRSRPSSGCAPPPSDAPLAQRASLPK